MQKQNFRFSQYAICALLIFFLLPTSSNAHDPIGERVVIFQGQPGVTAGPAKDVYCIIETAPHSHDPSGDNQIPNYIPVPGNSPPWHARCPRFHSAAYVDNLTSRNAVTAGTADTRSTNNSSRIEALEAELMDSRRQIEQLASQLETLSGLLVQAQGTINTHRSDFSSHKHDTDGEASSLPYYP